jgi:hypothetical protein
MQAVRLFKVGFTEILADLYLQPTSFCLFNILIIISL